ncbi:hypothetical protein ABZX51_009900 [Aspergillus tubingensis]
MWTLYNLSLTLLICFSHTGATQFLQTDYLSPRAENAIYYNQGWKNLSRDVLSRPYDRISHDGIINLGLAETWLMQDTLKDLLDTNFVIDPLYHLTYGQGAAGSPFLRKAVAEFFNAYFDPRQQVNESEIIIASGVTALIDSIAWNTCSDNEGIIIPQPLYNGFQTDMRLRSQGKLLPASFVWDNETYNFDKVFDATAINDSLERTWSNYTESTNKTTIRGVVIANPHNPLGRCYSKDALIAIARFCGKHKIHFISDEIYANTVFSNPGSNAPNFTSVLSLDLDDIIDPRLVHVLYGMSKDFGASGLRLGVLQSRNEDLIQAAYGVNLFSWPSYLVQDMWGRLLNDTTKTHEFLEENKRQLGKAYSTVTDWLRNKSIEYYDQGNAGLFVWARLLPNSTARPECFLEVCRNTSVYVGNGENFLPESGQTGWYRITFSYPDDMLTRGLTRLEKALNDTPSSCE